MKVLLISAFPPSKHNIDRPSALPFYLSKYSPPHVQIDLIYYEGYENKEYLFVDDLSSVYKNITKVKRSPKLLYYFLRLLQKFSVVDRIAGTDVRYIPTKKHLKHVRKENYDLVWFYPHTVFAWYAKLKPYITHALVTGPDCSYLHYQLVSEVYKKGSSEYKKPMLNNAHVLKIESLKANAKKIDTRWSRSKALIHVVGKDDCGMYKELGANGHVFFSSHPYSEYRIIKTDIAEEKGKLKVLITGVNHSIYIGTFLDRIINQLVNNKHLSDTYKFCFLGKGFDDCNLLLQEAGFESSLTKWVDSYEAFISEGNIHLFPIILGTGTKGKVLTSLATGLLCIGNKYAFENIAIDTENDCLFINNEYDAIAAFQKITTNREMFSLMAKRAAQKVRNAHSFQETGRLFWDEVKNYFKQ